MTCLGRSGEPVPAEVEALADRDDEPRALAALLGASRAGPRLVCLAALAALVDFEEPAAVERLIEVVRDPSDTEARALASQALAEAEEHPDAAPALVDILRQPRSEETQSLRHTALCSLEEIAPVAGPGRPPRESRPAPPRRRRDRPGGDPAATVPR